MTRLACMLLALLVPLAACDAQPPDEAPAPESSAPAAAASEPEAPAASRAEGAEPSLEELAAVEEPAGEAAAAPAGTIVTAQAGDAAAPFQEGKHYVRLPAAQPTSSSPDQIEVAEAFMYSCPHCAAFDPHIQKWLQNKPSNVSFVRLPVNFNPVAALHMRAYYAAETLGVLDKIHQPFFDEIHVKKNPLADVEALTKFFESQGVDRKTFEETMSSFAIDTKMRKAETLVRRYQVASVPTIIVNGKYRTDVGMAGGYDQIFKLIEFLVEKEAAEGAGDAPAAG
jgi:thiol:disulfide interchange protein DsbA